MVIHSVLDVLAVVAGHTNGLQIGPLVLASVAQRDDVIHFLRCGHEAARFARSAQWMLLQEECVSLLSPAATDSLR